MKGAGKVLWLVAALACAPGLAGCATMADNAPDDPLEPVNRLFFNINQKLDRNAALPAASYYAETVPNPARVHIHNVLSNLGGPVTCANYLLEGEFEYSSEALQRFLINTTLGVAGIFDVASDWDLPARQRDMGLTLGGYGLPEGPYMIIPFGGSTAFRDFAGSYFDGYFSPLRYVGEYNGRRYVGLMKNVVGTVDNRSANIDIYRDIERNSVDYYATMRDFYLQRRARQVEDKSVLVAELPDF